MDGEGNQIRDGRPADAGVVAELWTTAYVDEGEGGRTVPYVEEDFFETTRQGRLLVAERAGAVAGVVALLAPGAPGCAVARDEEAELSRLVVTGAARRHGIGRRLALCCEELAREEGWSAIALWSRSYQRAAHRLYESLDYRRLPERDTVDATGHERHVFRLDLSAPAFGVSENRGVERLTERLEGSIVVLEPLGPEHVEGLREAAQAPEIWTWLANLNERERFDLWLRLTFEAAEEGREGPFATLDARTGKVIGSSRYLNVRPADRALEIGWTWLAPSAWRSGANVEAKLLMMRHAFETLGCVRVEFKTDARNERSRAALAALPARFEGVMRNHMIVPDVGQRDSAYYSVIDSEWPRVRESLERRLERGDQPAEASDPSGKLTLRYADAVDELDALEPVWNALQIHHSEITPDLGDATPKRSLPDAWRIRRSKYERWLEAPDTFFVVAEADGAPAGYAFVTVGLPYASWASGERIAELETLSVLAERRGDGVGTALLDAVWQRLAELGVEDMQITTTVTNVDAHRFYEREGFRKSFAIFYGKAPRAEG